MPCTLYSKCYSTHSTKNLSLLHEYMKNFLFNPYCYKCLKVVSWDDHKYTSWILSHALIIILLPHWTWTHTGSSAWTKTPVSWASESKHQLENTACRWGWQIRAGLTSPHRPRSRWWSWRRRRWGMLGPSDWPVSDIFFKKNWNLNI